MVEECFGASAKANVDEIRADHLPVILIAYKEKGTVSIKQIVQGMWCSSKHFVGYYKRMSGWPSGLRRCVQVAVYSCRRGFESHF